MQQLIGVSCGGVYRHDDMINNVEVFALVLFICNNYDIPPTRHSLAKRAVIFCIFLVLLLSESHQ